MSADNPYAPPEADVEVANWHENQLASRWARLGGSLIDGLILGAGFWGAIYVFGLMDRALDEDMAVTAFDAVLLIGWLGLFLVLNGYLLATRGQTIGKVAARTRIVSFEDDRLLPLWKLMVLRYMPFYVLGYIPLIGPILGLINPLFIFKQDRRCLHDHVAGTKVIYADSPPAR